MPRKDRQRERRERQRRAAALGPTPRAAADVDGIPYRRKCHQCGRQVEGAVGSFGGLIPAQAVPVLELLVSEHGHYVCAECDGDANMGWLLDIQSHLDGRPFDED